MRSTSKSEEGLLGKSLQEELAVFEQHRSEWVRSHRGEFVAIIDRTVIGFYPDFETGFRAGLSRVGLGRDFLLKQIWAEDPVYTAY